MTGPAPQHSQRLLGTLLGDYWFWRAARRLVTTSAGKPLRA
ncbi:hypothetical protein [Amycolatopsis sp. ATCC 39116]|nr:hypothetical protein [Amycolatopsis sp. ATCC 39116]